MENIAEMFEKYKSLGGSASQMARDIGVSLTYVSKSLSGWENFKLSNLKKGEIDLKISTYLMSKIEGETPNSDSRASVYESIILEAGYLAFVNTSNIIASVIKCSKQKSLMKITAPSGTGKTTALKIIANKIPQMCVVTAYDGMSGKEFLEDLVGSLGVKSLGKNAKDLMRDVKKFLNTSKKLIVVDEANFLKEKSLEQLRHIHDVCEVATLLVGTEALDMTIARSHPQVATRIRGALEVRAFGVLEVSMMCAKYGIFEEKAEEIFRAKKNLRDVEYFLQDYLEVYDSDTSAFKEGLKRF